MRIASFLFQLLMFSKLISASESVERASQYIDISPKNDTYLKIAFGSCYGKFDTDIFETIVKDEPDVWIWLGDATYIDQHPIVEWMAGIDSSTEEHARERFNDTL